MASVDVPVRVALVVAAAGVGGVVVVFVLARVVQRRAGNAALMALLEDLDHSQVQVAFDAVLQEAPLVGKLPTASENPSTSSGGL